MTDCISLPEEYKPLEGIIEKIVEDKINRNEEHFNCIKRNIENAESIEALNLASDELKIYRSKLIEDVVHYLAEGAKSHNELGPLAYIYHKTFPHHHIKGLVAEFIGKKTDEKITKILGKINEAFVLAVKRIANNLHANGYSVTIGMPFTFTVTLNFDVK